MNRLMKDSGSAWIGDIPEDWEVKSLKSVLVERKENNSPIKTDFILSLTMDRGVIPYNEKSSGGNKAKDDLSKYKLAYPNDIVLNSMNVIAGSVGLSKYFGCVSPVYYMLYPRNTDHSVDYYNDIFQAKVFQESLIGLGNGILIKQSESSGKLNTIRMRIPMGKLNAVSLPIPPSKEQHKIARFLNEKIKQINTIITKTEQTIEYYKSYRQSIITKTVTTGLNDKIKMKNSEIEWIGEIPEHWNIKRLGFLGSLQNGISKSSEHFGFGFPFVSYSDVYKNIELPKEVVGLVNASKTDRHAYSVKHGDVFFTRTSETIEEIGLTSTCLKTIENATFAGFLIRFRPESTELIPGFSKYFFRSDIHRKYFVKEMNLVTRASLSQELLKKLPVLLPSVEEQKQIADFLDTECSNIESLINQKRNLVNELVNYKNSIIYETVTGKIDVRNYKENELEVE